jgi:hypothetical protein
MIRSPLGATAIDNDIINRQKSALEGLIDNLLYQFDTLILLAHTTHFHICSLHPTRVLSTIHFYYFFFELG